MPVVNQTGLAADVPAGVPLIGYDNLVTSSNISSSTAQTDFPVTNLADPATHLKWKGGVNTGDELISINLDSNSDVNYLAIAGHNFYSAGIIVSIEYTEPAEILLHFNGADASTTFTDSNTSGSAHTWTGGGGAQIDTAQSKFGGSSLLFLSAVSTVTTVNHGDFDLGADFTFDFWMRTPTLAAAAALFTDSTDSNNFLQLKVLSTGDLQLNKKTAGVTTTIAQSAAGAIAINTWYHIAVVRSGDTFTIYKDGNSVATATTAITFPTYTGNFIMGGISGDSMNGGWIDEFRMISGIAKWTANFTPPTAEAGSFTTLVSATLSNSPDTSSLTNDDPIIFRWSPVAISTLRVRLHLNVTAPQAAVIYVGEILALERSITIGRKHVPINYGRRSNIVNGMTEQANFLGRISLGSHRQSKAEFEWFQGTFYRSDIDDFLIAAQEIPFFWAWSPTEYPEETGYVWLTNNPEPETDPATRRIALTLEMQGIGS